VIDAGLAFVAHAGELALRRDPRQELDHRLADGIKSQLVRPARRVLDSAQRDAEAAFPQLSARFKVPYDDTDVLYALDLHSAFPFRLPAMIDGLPTRPLFHATPGRLTLGARCAMLRA
jgi:hypothetical protein